MGRKRIKQVREDYRKGGRVQANRGGRFPSFNKRDDDLIINKRDDDMARDDFTSIERQGGDPRVGNLGPSSIPSPGPSSVAVNTGPGFVTGQGQNRADYYQAAADRGQNRGRGRGGNNTTGGTYQNGGGEQNGGGDNNGGDQGSGPQEPPNGQGTVIRNVNGVPYIFMWNGYTYINTGQVAGNQGGGDEGGGTSIDPDPLSNMSDAQKKAAFESERRTRNVLTGRDAGDIASGNIPEGTIPVPIVNQIGREGTEAPTVTAPDAGQAETFTTPDAPIEEVSTVDEVETIDPAREVTAQVTPTETVEKAAQVKAAQQDREELRLAEAAEIGNAPIIDEVEVEIKEGSVAPVVVGELSPGAKARIVENTGTSLARVTRAKKQLENAGLNVNDVDELGNDPEALEARLMDFSEEERGVIEGLPEEALVSNQLDSLLSGVEQGEIPIWARPAVSTVETMLAKRGLEASSIARDALVNTLIQASIPLAQANAQAIQASVSQQRNIEAAVSEANAQRRQQTVLNNAQNVFKVDMANMAAEQQTELANSKFFQTVSLTDANIEQQSAVQNAAAIARVDLAEADFYQKAQIENAKNFLATDMANLNNRQQSNVIKGQYEQQRLLSNQAAINAMGQFNATNDRQAQQFMAQIETQIRQYNAGYINATNQFNVQAENAAEARDAQRINDVNRANAAIMNQVEQFNQQQNFNREQWNAANEQAVINSNIDWRRRANTADTAAQNAVNQQNAQNAFGLTQAAQSFLWQELRDQADYDFRWATDTANRKVQAMMSAAGAEGDAAKNWSTNFSRASSTINSLFS